MKYTLGLDLGTTSVGWAVLNPGEQRIEDLGVRIFPSAEHPKDGSSLAEPRRLARGARRRLARRGMRLNSIKQLFIKNGLLTLEEIKQIHASPNNPYELRVKGLDLPLTARELFIAIYHLAKRRGYKSNRKKALEVADGVATQEQKEAREVLGSIQDNQNAMRDGGFRTVGEMLLRDLNAGAARISFEGIRNKTGSYKHSVSREMLLDELKMILDAQQKLAGVVSDKLKDDLVDAFAFQRPFASGDRLKNLVGKCQFEKGERRAARASFSFQYFRVLETLNRLVVNNENTGQQRMLTLDEKHKILDDLMDKREYKYGQLKRVLGLGQESRFNLVRYYVAPKKAAETGMSREDQADAIEKKEKFPSMSDFYCIRKAIKEADEQFWGYIQENHDVLDQIGEVLSLYKTDEDITKNLRLIEINDEANAIPEPVIASLLTLSFSKFGHLSLKALKKIIPFLEEGKVYSEAVRMADPKYGEFQTKPEMKLKPLPADDHSLTNPVVRRTVSQAIKVINAVVERYGSPAEVHIEFGRELAKDFGERRNITKNQEENRNRNEHAKEEISKLFSGREAKGHDIVRYKLWKEQGCKCAYSGKSIDEVRLFDEGYTEIDHIVPFSRSFDDSYANKVLVLTAENREKLNQLPYEAFGHDENRWQAFENLVATMNISPRKKHNLLLKKYVMDDLTARTLNDTRFIARYLRDYIKAGLMFSDGKAQIVTVNGMATAYLRKRWALNKVREENDRHHAMDAAVVAAASPRFIQRIAHYAKVGEVKSYLKYHKDLQRSDIPSDIVAEAKVALERGKEGINERFPQPWKGFTDELEVKVYGQSLFVSRMPTRTVSGRAHKDTLYSPKRIEDGIATVKKPLTSLKAADLEKARSSMDPQLYAGLKSRLDKYDGDGQKAFAEPFYKVQKNGERGPIVRAIKLPDVQKSGVELNDGTAIAERASMIRVDVFSKEVQSGKRKGSKEWYFVPIYAHQVRKGLLPNRVVTPGKSESEWEAVTDAFHFEFSLHPGDLFYLEKDNRKEYWYYVKADIATGSLSGESHDRSLKKSGIGIKTLDKMEKCMVGVLGDIHKVSHEARQDFTNLGNTKKKRQSSRD